MQPRDEIIADWQERLAAASDADAPASGRSAWLMRVRRRLYRFLLSLYGDGHWNAPPDAPSGGEHAPAGFFEAPHDLPLSGKPARCADDIRTVLSGVARAQDHPPAAGPLIAGLPAESWVVVGAASAGLSVRRLQALLRRQRLSVRVSVRGDDRHVEVRAKDRQQALALIEERLSELRGRDREPSIGGGRFAAGFAVVTLLSPFFVATVLTIYLWLASQSAVAVTLVKSHWLVLLFGGWGACMVLYCAVELALWLWLWIRQQWTDD